MSHCFRFFALAPAFAAAALLLAGPALAQPVVTSLAPAAAAAGTTVVVSGTGFSAAPGRMAVTFGAVRAAVTAASATQLTVRVPLGAASVAPVTVTDLVSQRQGSSLASATPFFTLRFAGPGLNAASYQATRYPVGTAQFTGFIGRDIAAADFNADNYPDFAIVADGQVILTFGDGQGSYGPPLQLPAGISPNTVQVADVDANGAPDLLVGTTPGFVLLRNLGNGNGFASAAPLLSNSTSVDGLIAVQDMDGDGLPDLIGFKALSTTTGQLLELRNNGSGFDAPTVLLAGRLGTTYVADFNQDGRLDIAVLGADQFVSQPPYQLRLLARNAANTGYDAPVRTAFNTFVFGGPLADFNADGRPDIAASATLPSGANALAIVENTAAGFVLQSPFQTLPPGNRFQFVADADGDGLTDLVGSGFVVLPGLAGGGFGQLVTYNVAGTTFVAGDFDLDGRTDLAAYDITSGDLIVYRYTGLSPNVNNPPTLNALADITLDEDAPPQTVALTGIGNGGEPGQAVRITAVSSDPNLVPNPTIAYFSPTATGTLRFQPAPNAFGTCRITVTASDGQPQNSTVVRSFLVTVNPVNDAPTLDPIPDVVVTQQLPLSGISISVPLSGITAGAANENQLLTLGAATSVNINAYQGNGTFAYTSPATTGSYLLLIQGANVQPGFYGTVTVTVNDGQPTNNTFSRTFRIYYNPGGTTPGLPTAPPTLDAIDDIQANRALPAQLPVDLAGIGDGDPTQVLPLTVTAVSSDPTLISLGTLAYTSPNATGTLPYAIASTRGGAATVRVTVSNGQPQNGTVTRSFLITVRAAPVVSASRGPGGGPGVALYPNPAPGGRFALAGAAPGPLTLTVFDLSGRLVLERQLEAGPQPLQLALPAAVAAGTYALRLTTASGTVTKRLVVE